MAEKVARVGVKKEGGYLYFVDKAGDVSRALQAFKEALHFDDTNAWLCHQISRIHFEQENFEEALRLNEKALSLQSDFPEAQALRERLAEHQRSSGFLGRLFG